MAFFAETRHRLSSVHAAPPALDEWVSAFLDSLGGKSPRTYATYQAGLARFREFLQARQQLDGWQPTELGPSTLEDFYGWLVRRHGRQRRTTVTTYSAGLRGFVRFLAR